MTLIIISIFIRDLYFNSLQPFYAKISLFSSFNNNFNNNFLEIKDASFSRVNLIFIKLIDRISSRENYQSKISLKS